MASAKPFPTVTGGCVCNAVRYRLLTSPLYCYACHCADCQKLTGSAFGHFLSIEAYNVQVLSATRPTFVRREKKPGSVDCTAECGKCGVQLWTSSYLCEGLFEVRVGTLDFPGLMEPDVHIFVESKLDWVGLPEGAKTVPGFFNHLTAWPKTSLRRLEICKQRTEEVKRRSRAAAAVGKEGDGATVEAVDGVVDEGGAEGEKTPTAGEFGGEDDEQFEKRVKEKEKALLERLEKLSLKLGEEHGTEKTEKASVASTGVDG